MKGWMLHSSATGHGVPEKRKVPGVRYATACDGVELPVVDVTDPRFVITLRDNEQAQLVEQFLREGQPFARAPAPIRRALMRLFLRRSILGRAIQRAEGTFMTGMDTYLLKLGPENLPTALATPVDRRIAASLPALSVRIRMQDVARLLADSIETRLEEAPQRLLHLVSIGGGPAIECLNALVLLQRDHPELLAERHMVVTTLDPDAGAATFGARALDALREIGAPLHGLDVAFRHRVYDWRRPTELADALAVVDGDPIVAASSEGGLFEYGSDDDIRANLEHLHDAAIQCTLATGSVTRADEPVQRLRALSRPTTRPRGLDAFRRLAGEAGWRVVRAIERPFSDQVLLQPATRAEADRGGDDPLFCGTGPDGRS